MPVAAAMDLMDEPGRLIAVRSSCSIVENGMYSRTAITSIKKVRAQEWDSGFFFSNTKKSEINQN